MILENTIHGADVDDLTNELIISVDIETETQTSCVFTVEVGAERGGYTETVETVPTEEGWISAEVRFPLDLLNQDGAIVSTVSTGDEESSRAVSLSELRDAFTSDGLDL